MRIALPSGTLETIVEHLDAPLRASAIGVARDGQSIYVPLASGGALNLEPNMLKYVAERAEKDGQPNIVPVMATTTSPSLAPSSVDLFFICNTIHHIGSRGEYYKILARDLRDGGRLAIVDFYKDIELDSGPSRQMRIAKKALIAEVTAAGFRLVEEHDFLPVQYFVVFEAP